MNRSLLGPALALVVLFATPLASAQSRAVEAQARALQKKAMQEDYLGTEFAKGEDKLNQAVAKCGADRCSAQLRAELRRDLGVVQIGGQIDKEKGIAHWVEAIKLDPTLQLDPDVKTKEFEKLFEEAKKQAAGAPGAAPPKGDSPSGDFVHTPVTEQVARTPLPVYAEYAGSEQVVRVVAKYKGFGMPDWKTFELRKLGNGYGSQLPCVDVQQGEVLYYLQGFNAQSDPVATSGDRNNPFRVAVKQKIDGEAPHLPNQPAPKQCAEATTDCPPDFPGCKKVAAPLPQMTEEDSSKKDEGDECDESGECKSSTCRAGKCAAATKKFPRFWIGASGSFDFVFLGSASEVCRLDTDGLPFGKSGYYCTRGEVDFPPRPDVDRAGVTNRAIEAGKLNMISGGAALGNIRVMLSFDYAVNPNVLVGARVGYVLGSYPGNAAKAEGKAFAPIHLEARGTYLIGKDALQKPFAGFVFLGAGVTELSSKIDVNVSIIGETPQKQTVQAWALSAPLFISPGGGMRIAFSSRAALMVAPIRFMFALGSNGFLPAYSPEVALHFGI